MSSHAEAENPRFAELRRLVRHLGDELAGYRKRALTAESRLKAAEDAAARTEGVTPERLDSLEKQNTELRRRLDEAQRRTELLLSRVRLAREGAGRE